jgi:hypothetical protein
MMAATLSIVLAVLADPGNDSNLGLADLPAYKKALEDRGDGPAVSVGFRDLWDHPDRFRGRLVRVEGRVVRRFNQTAVGAFPPLSETWIVNPEGDPLCLVCPTPDDRTNSAIGPGKAVRFEGTFLRHVRYVGGDSARLAPLIIGGRAPDNLIKQGSTMDGPPLGWSRTDWAVGAVLAGLVALVLVRQALRRPARSGPRLDPPVQFEDQSTLDPPRWNGEDVSDADPEA